MNKNEKPSPLLHLDAEVGRRQVAKLAALRQRRDNQLVTQRLHLLEKGAQGTENLMPLILDAVEAYATLGEISDTLRRVFGEQHAFQSME